MRICVAHETVYRYDTPPSGVIQTLRMTPRNHDGQYVVDWRIDVSADCRLEANEDAFGNIVHAFSTGGPIEELRVLVEGEVETQDTAGIVRGTVERFPPSLFLRETPMTRADDAILAYARQFPRPDEPATLQTLHALLAKVHQDLMFDPGAENPNKTAAEAFANERGNWADFTHVFLAIVRSLGVPARFVSGYFRGADSIAAKIKLSQVQSQSDQQSLQEMAQDLRDDAADGEAKDRAHAWAEAHVPGLGWVGFDPVNGVCVTDQHIRVAIGLDQLGAAPVRGAHYGGGRELLAVKLIVSQAAWQAQG